MQINSQMRIHNQELISDNTSGVVNGIIRAAKVVTSYQIGDSYVTELELNVDKMESMSAVGQSHYIPRNDKVIF